MTKNLDNEGLRSIADNYQLFYIDLWGVVHNGINLHDKAIFTLKEITKKNKEYVLLTNAPRPNSAVKVFLEKMGMEKEIIDHVFTSGEAALSYLNKNHLNDSFFHIGPPRDFDLFQDFKKNKSEEIKESKYILCTGLFDNHDEELNYYKDLLEKHLNKKMICTNPDLIVHRGKKEEYCAGKIAEVFESSGGKVIYFGKPHEEVYKMCFDKKEKVLAIGDNLRTDIKGANNLGIDSLFIYHGVHRDEIKNENDILKVIRNYDVLINYFQFELNW